MKRRMPNILIGVVLFVMAISTVYGQQYEVALEGADIFAPATLQITDDICETNDGSCNGYQVCNQKAYIMLEADPLEGLFNGGNSGVYTVELELSLLYDLYDPSSGSLTPITMPVNHTLNIAFSHEAGVYQNKDAYLIENGFNVQATIETVTIKLNNVVLENVDLPGTVHLLNGYTVNRYLPLDGEGVDVNMDQPSINVDNGNITFELSTLASSTHVDAVEAFELEWAWIDDERQFSSVSAQTYYSHNYKNDATRVRLESSSYTISDIYRPGKIVARVRGIGRSNCNKEIYTDWSSSMIYSDGATVGHNPDLNWQHSRVYAEEGKSKDVISYFDGSLHSRQTVSKLKEDDHVVVAEAYYDHVGRPTVQAIPAPYMFEEEGVYKYQSKIDFIPDFNKGNLSNGYSRLNFEHKEDDGCISSADPFHESSGSGQYYSINNRITDGHQAYVPDASGYPLSQTIFTQDGTGRPRIVSGVGPHHQIGYTENIDGEEVLKSKATKYYYGTPEQAELDILFGNDVGYASYYKRNMVIDPNGQVSISYLDNKGRVIATALSGKVPDQVDPLDGVEEQTPKSIPADLMLKNNLSDYGTENSKSIYTATKTVEAEGSIFSYDYQFTGTQFDQCIPEPIDCKYDLDIYATDECDKSIGSNSESTILIPFSDKNITSFDHQFAFEDLKIGSFNTTKKLSLNAQSIEEYITYYLENETCIEDEIVILNDLLTQVEFNSCGIKESCITDCITQVYDANKIVNTEGQETFDISTEEFVDQIMDCVYDPENDCEDVTQAPDNYCEKLYADMIDHLSPYGQYGKVRDASGVIVEQLSDLPCNSIYNDAGVLGTGFSNFFANNFASDYEAIIDGQPKLLKEATLEEIVRNFREEWLTVTNDLDQSILMSHPEYCFFEWCDAIDDGDWEHDFLNTTDPKIARDRGYFNPVQSGSLSSTYPELLPLSNDNLDYDPYRFEGSASLLQVRMNEYIEINGQMHSMWDMAYIMYLGQRVDLNALFAANNSNPDFQPSSPGQWANDFGLDGCTTYGYWKIFQSLYIAEKNQIKYDMDHLPNGIVDINTCIEAQDGMPSFYVCSNEYVDESNCPCEGNWDDAIPAFVPLASDGPSNLYGLSIDDILAIDFEDIENGTDTTIPDAAEQELETRCNETCEAYREQWRADLSGCGMIVDLIVVLAGDPLEDEEGYTSDPDEDHMDRLLDQLVSICEEGCDYTHPMGASSSPNGSSFQAKIEQFLMDTYSVQASDYDFDCNPYIITSPLPYQNDIFAGSFPLIDDCNCSKYTTILNEFEVVTGAQSTDEAYMSQFLDYVNDAYKQDLIIDQIVDLHCACTDDIPDAFKLEVAASTLPIPEPFTCISCYTCEQITPIYQDFLNALPEAEVLTEESIQDLEFLQYAATWFNTELGFNLTWLEYFDFFAHCKIDLDGVTAATLVAQETNGTLASDQDILRRIKNRGATTTTASRSVSSNLLTFILEASPQVANPGDEITLTYILGTSDINHVDNVTISDHMIPGWKIVSISDAPGNTDSYTITNDNESFTYSGIKVLHAVGTEINVTVKVSEEIYAPQNFYNQGMVECEDMDDLYSDDNGSYNDDPDPTPIFINLEDPCTGNVATAEDFVMLLNELKDKPLDTYFNIKDDLTSFGVNSTLDIWDIYGDENLDVMLSIDNGEISIMIMNGCEDVILCSISFPGLSSFDDIAHFNSASPVIDYSTDDNGDMDFHYTINVEYTNGTTGNIDAYSSCYPLIDCDDLTLCNRSIIIEYDPTEDEQDCLGSFLDIIATNASTEYRTRQEAAAEQFVYDYSAACISGAGEIFTSTSQNFEYHHTLYYYDQSGSLVRTIPPEGVDYGVDLAQVGLHREDATEDAEYPAHRLKTTYQYNSYNQVITQDSPDADEQKIWYDRLGRAIVSQDGRQRDLYPGSSNVYSYTIHDSQGRIQETGEIINLTPISDAIAADENAYAAWLQGANKTHVIRTIYDASIDIDGSSTTFNDVDTYFDTPRRYLRKRISSVFYYGDQYDPASPEDYTHACHYDYDVHGNVKTLINEFSELRDIGQSLKRIDYTYDLISGNVHKVAYQSGAPDQFYHKYSYDSDNRIKEVYTSQDDLIWDRDAAYEYYDHGPLARTELGEHNVQGIDYAYTIHGWIKGVNSNTMYADRDIGKDGSTLDPNNPNQNFPEDAYGYSLGYYSGDYLPASPPADAMGNPSNENYFLADEGSTGFQNLYNGNISRMVTGLRDLTGGKLPSQASAYTYDQLHRIKSMQKYGVDDNINVWNPINLIDENDYKTNYSYDGNGNIKTLQRYNQESELIDDLTYHYEKVGDHLVHNKLNRVEDHNAIDFDPDDNDIISQSDTYNYVYDKAGNMIKDLSEDIDQINWNHFGKIDNLLRASGTDLSTQPNMHYRYDAMGNRISKVVQKGTAAEGYTYTIYSRDASGNVMAVYKGESLTPDPLDHDDQLSSLYTQEHHLYGSSRLGIRISDLADVDIADPSYQVSNTEASHTISNRYYELSNHLSNVLSTVTDNKLYVDGGITSYRADIKSYSDYYPFGWQMPDRNANSDTYRYGFNGEEKVDDVKGSGVQYDYGFRIYDARIAKFLSVDPLTASYPMLTPYQFASNTPIAAIDIDGLEGTLVINRYRNGVPFDVKVLKVWEGKPGERNNRNFNAAGNNISGLSKSQVLVIHKEMSTMSVFNTEVLDELTSEQKLIIAAGVDFQLTLVAGINALGSIQDGFTFDGTYAIDNSLLLTEYRGVWDRIPILEEEKYVVEESETHKEWRPGWVGFTTRKGRTDIQSFTDSRLLSVWTKYSEYINDSYSFFEVGGSEEHKSIVRNSLQGKGISLDRIRDITSDSEILNYNYRFLVDVVNKIEVEKTRMVDKGRFTLSLTY